MNNIFEKLNLKVNYKEEKKFEKYAKLLVEYNQKFNLTSICEEEEIYLKHFADSIFGAEFINGNTLIDIGSGGGFPAIPLKIVCENVELTMMDATGKKCEFLKTVAKELELQNVTVINGRAEEYSIKNELRDSYDICTARAVARLNVLAEYCMPFVKVGGRFIAYKGDAKEEIQEAENAIKALGGQIEEIKEFDLLNNKRTIVVIKKVEKTNKLFPRKNGVIKKKPL